MRRIRHGLALEAVVSGLLVASVLATTPADAATTPAPQALAYVSSGQVKVFEAGQVTTAGSGQSPVWSPNGANLLFVHPDFVAGVAGVFVTDTHGNNAHAVISGAYPYITPSWSGDSKFIVYATVRAGAGATGKTVPLEIRAFNPSTKQARVLANVTIAGGCSQAGTALQVAAATAQGTYRGTPSTVIWAQPNLVAVQSSCTGSGLTIVPLGGKPFTLADWSGGVLSPDGKMIAAAVGNGPHSNGAHLGLLNVTTHRTTIIKPPVSAGVLAWTPDSKAVITAVQPTDPLHGTVEVLRESTDGKSVTALAFIPSAGAFHPSVDHAGKSVAFAAIDNASPTVGAIPQITIDLVPAQKLGVAQPYFIGSQPAWRP
jgi:Tol biopolymer transport system component